MKYLGECLTLTQNSSMLYRFLDWFINHSAVLVFLISLALSLTLIVWLLRKAGDDVMKNKSSEGAALDRVSIDRLEALIKELLDRAQSVAHVSQQNSTEDSQQLTKKIQELQAQLQEKNLLIQNLSKKEISDSQLDFSAFEKKIAELEAKLAEYEIIAEDIADLSRYKEENRELKKRLQQIEGNNLSKNLSPAQTVDDDLMNQFVNAVRGDGKPMDKSGPEQQQSGFSLKALENEAQVLVSVAETSQVVADAVIGVEPNTEKLAQEADKLMEEKENKELLQEFAQFVESKGVSSGT